MADDHFTTPEIRRGRIYRNVYHKRIDRQRIDGTANLQRAYVERGALIFNSAQSGARALADGAFLLGIPDEIDVSVGDEFARQFYRGSSTTPYGRFRDVGPDHFSDQLLGFHQRTNQIEQFLLERRFWRRDYPHEIAELGEALTLLSQIVLRAVLMQVGVPIADWSRASGGCSDLTGSYHLTFNHYRPAMQNIGLNSHKDDGFVTILRTTAAGLELNCDDHWVAAPTEPTHFIVNFGLAMEILTARCGTPVAAIMHRVARQGDDRWSFGHFSSSRCEPYLDAGIYQYLPDAGLNRVCGSRELIDENDYEIYEGTEDPEERS